MKTWREKLSAALCRTANLYPYDQISGPAFEVVKGIFLTPDLKFKTAGFSCSNVIRWQLCLIDPGLNPAAVDDQFMTDMVALVRGQLE